MTPWYGLPFCTHSCRTVQNVRVALLHNPQAGDGSPSEDELRLLIEALGHEVGEVIGLPDEGEDLEIPATELLVIAGGDGTVGAAAVPAATRGTPIAILALGTANNLATSLGVESLIETQVMSWHDAAFREIDIGIARTGRGQMPFMEGAGAGALADLVLAKASGPRELDRTARLARAWARFERRLTEYEAVPTRIVVDDDVVEGEFVLVEVLNTPRTGPGVEFAPAADPGDGLLDVVMLRAVNRELRGPIDPVEIPERVETYRGRHVEIEVPKTAVHVDGFAYRTEGERWSATLADVRLKVASARPD